MSSAIQLGLFDNASPMSAPQTPATATAPVAPANQPVIRLSLAPRRAAVPKRAMPASRPLTARDMPEYSQEEIEAVDRVIAEISSDRLLLGYKEIQNLFGVSKATANRRMKDGLVPGVRIQHGVVSRDGGVRRFSREQVKWLLLAVRSTRRAG